MPPGFHAPDRMHVRRSGSTGFGAQGAGIVTGRKSGVHMVVLRSDHQPRPAPPLLPATPDTCYWGYLDAAQPAALAVDPGTELWIEAVTHHAGDAPDLLMDDGIHAIWDAIPPRPAPRACTS